VSGQGDSDDVIVTSIGPNHPRRVERIVEPYRILLKIAAQRLNLITRNPVPGGDTRMEQGPSNLGDEVRTRDELEGSIAPQVDQLVSGTSSRDCPRNQTIGIENEDQSVRSGSARPGRRRSLLVDELVRQAVRNLLIQIGLGANPIDHAKTLSQSLLEHVGISTPGPGRPYADSAHELFVDRQRRLRPSHIAILP